VRPWADDAARARGYRPGVNAPAQLRPRIARFDVMLAAVVAAIQLGGSSAEWAHRANAGRACLWGTCVTHPLNAWGYVLLCLGPVALLVRRRHPRAVFAFVLAATLTYAVASFPVGPSFLSLIVAFVTVVIAGRRWFAWAAIALGWALFLWLPSAFAPGRSPTLGEAVGIGAWLLVLTFAAEVIRGRRERIHAQRRTREAEIERRAEEERLRIARELHDVLAHNISLINVQSGVALHLLDERPEQARTALAVINEASADALREMRSVLGVLRGVDEQAPRRPTAGLDRLEDLVSSTAAAGVDVRIRSEGPVRPLSVPVDSAAFRIVQESLTNVARHAGGGRAAVTLRYGPDALAVEVDDAGPAGGVPTGAPPVNGTGTGNGIAGMRERALALGGELEAGPRRDGPGFRVRARLPYGGGS